MNSKFSQLLTLIINSLRYQSISCQMKLFFHLTEEVLQGVAAGIDLFDSTYVAHLRILFSKFFFYNSLLSNMVIVLQVYLPSYTWRVCDNLSSGRNSEA